jgi:hypothetical protein
MATNPYSAPKAVVADPKLVAVERPRVVTRAVALLWISFLAALVSSYLDVAFPEDAGADSVWIGIFVITTIWLAVVAWLIFKLARGRNWARFLYLILAVLSYGLLAFAWQEFAADFRNEPVKAAVGVAGMTMELVAMYLLFTKPANAWYAQPMKVEGSES